MSALPAQIVELLAQQTELAKGLLEALQADKQSIIAHDTAALEQSNRHKEALVARLHAAERRRHDACLELARTLGLTPEDAVVARIAERLRAQGLGAQGQSLSDAADRLRAVILSLRELVAVSHGFLEQSILGIRGLIGLIATVRARDAGTYDATGRIAVDPSSAPIALRQEA